MKTRDTLLALLDSLGSEEIRDYGWGGGYNSITPLKRIDLIEKKLDSLLGLLGYVYFSDESGLRKTGAKKNERK